MIRRWATIQGIHHRLGYLNNQSLSLRTYCSTLYMIWSSTLTFFCMIPMLVTCIWRVLWNPSGRLERKLELMSWPILIALATLIFSLAFYPLAILTTTLAELSEGFPKVSNWALIFTQSFASNCFLFPPSSLCCIADTLSVASSANIVSTRRDTWLQMCCTRTRPAS